MLRNWKYKTLTGIWLWEVIFIKTTGDITWLYHWKCEKESLYNILLVSWKCAYISENLKQ